MDDLYNAVNQLDSGSDVFGNPQIVDALIKATTAGSTTGRTLDSTITSGASLKVESLEPTLKILTNRDKHIKFYKMLPKQKAYNTVEEYNQLVDYGGTSGIFNSEGELPQFTDSQYRRKSVLIKYTGIAGEVTHPAMLVKTGSGVSDLFAQEVQNKTMYLMRALNTQLSTANSDNVANEFDGYFKQHFDGIVGAGGTLANYKNSSAVIDARGASLTDANIEDAAHAIVNDGFGTATGIISAPVVFNDYVKQFHESKRVNVGLPGDATTGATMGQKVNQTATQFGMIDLVDDIFFDRRLPKAYNAAAENAQSPAVIIVDGGAPLAVETDTSNEFATAGAGDYFYAVASKNRYGESAMTIMSTTTLSVSASQSVDIKFTITDNAYAAESFVIYRTEKDTLNYLTADFYPIFTVNLAERTAGYDGGIAGLVRDRNRELPNTKRAFVFDNSTEMWGLKQLAPIMRMDLAVTSPSRRFMILSYLTPVLYAPKKLAIVKNIGRA